MKCYYHPDKDAVGTCSQCGKACCRDCIEDIGGALLCKDCIVRERQRVAAYKKAAIKNAKSIIMLSWILTIGISIFFIPSILIEDPIIYKKILSIPVIGNMILYFIFVGKNVLFMPFYDKMGLFSSVTGKIVLSVLVVYTIWSTFWAWRVIQPWQRGISHLNGWILSFSLFFMIRLLFFSFYFIATLIYGCLGGGIYQYLKYRKIAKGKL